MRVGVISVFTDYHRRGRHHRGALQPQIGPLVAALLPPDVEIDVVNDTWDDPDWSRDYDLVFLSSLHSDFDRARQISHYYRRRGAKTVLGGPIASHLPAALRAVVRRGGRRRPGVHRARDPCATSPPARAAAALPRRALRSRRRCRRRGSTSSPRSRSCRSRSRRRAAARSPASSARSPALGTRYHTRAAATIVARPARRRSAARGPRRRGGSGGSRCSTTTTSAAARCTCATLCDALGAARPALGRLHHLQRAARRGDARRDGRERLPARVRRPRDASTRRRSPTWASTRTCSPRRGSVIDACRRRGILVDRRADAEPDDGHARVHRTASPSTSTSAACTCRPTSAFETPFPGTPHFKRLAETPEPPLLPERAAARLQRLHPGDAAARTPRRRTFVAAYLARRTRASTRRGAKLRKLADDLAAVPAARVPRAGGLRPLRDARGRAAAPGRTARTSAAPTCRRPRRRRAVRRDDDFASEAERDAILEPWAVTDARGRVLRHWLRRAAGVSSEGTDRAAAGLRTRSTSSRLAPRAAVPALQPG